MAATLGRAIRMTVARNAALPSRPLRQGLLARPSIVGTRFECPDVAQRRFSRLAMCVRACYSSKETGTSNSTDFRIFFSDKQGKQISPWHDVPLYTKDGHLSFVCEIPRETAAKMECATDEENTPIKQDTKKGKLRFYPYNINWNYGLLPQTWEDPDKKNEDLDTVGDNDPVDVVEIGTTTLKMGGVYSVKPLGVYAMIDEGELDWKVIAINIDDPKAPLVNDVEDVEREFPGELERIMVWFRDYKTPDGKPQNSYGYDGQCMNKEFTLKVIAETHEAYKALKTGSRANTEELALV